jgi:SAM-dependent methyltransferase
VLSLSNHPRTRHLVERAAHRALRRTGSPYRLALPAPVAPPPEPGGQPPAPDLARALLPGSLAVERSAVSRLLFERLSPEDVAEIRRRLPESAELDAHYAVAPTDAVREGLILIAGVWLKVPGVAEKTGLLSAQPPEDVHAMARGPLAAGGGLYEADLVADALAGVGVELADVSSILDFGCSSGRVLRALAAAYPDTRLYGCDPNAPAVAWAGEHLPKAELFVSGDNPPLPLGDCSLDLVYAISIWSHFAPELGLRWLQEMHRVIRPGGQLVMTTHGPTSIAYYAALNLRTPQQSEEILRVLYRDGWWYAAEFGKDGDWGVVNPDWGTAFLSPEWLLAQLCPRWRVLEFAPGRNQNNQDVYVLQRV